MKNNLSENIRNLRTLRGLNQVEFAKIMGVTKQCISNWENDNVLPSIEMLVRLSSFFCVSTDKLLGLCEKDIINVSGLTDEQISHISALVLDLRRLNDK